MVSKGVSGNRRIHFGFISGSSGGREEEVRCFAKIRGTAYKLLKYIEDIPIDRESRWNM